MSSCRCACNHCPAIAGFERQARLGANESFYLALLVDRDDDSVRRWVHVEADHIFDLLGEYGISGAFERAQTMLLEAGHPKKALDGVK